MISGTPKATAEREHVPRRSGRNRDKEAPEPAAKDEEQGSKDGTSKDGTSLGSHYTRQRAASTYRHLIDDEATAGSGRSAGTFTAQGFFRRELGSGSSQVVSRVSPASARGGASVAGEESAADAGAGAALGARATWGTSLTSLSSLEAVTEAHAAREATVYEHWLAKTLGHRVRAALVEHERLPAVSVSAHAPHGAREPRERWPHSHLKLDISIPADVRERCTAELREAIRGRPTSPPPGGAAAAPPAKPARVGVKPTSPQIAGVKLSSWADVPADSELTLGQRSPVHWNSVMRKLHERPWRSINTLPGGFPGSKEAMMSRR